MPPQISEAEARADSEARGDSSSTPNTAAAAAAAAGTGMGTREPRPPILQARFCGARVVYLQRFTMEQASGRGMDAFPQR